MSRARRTWQCAVLVTAAAVGAAACAPRPIEPVRMHGVLVMSALHLPGAVVRGARRDWWLDRRRPVRVGDPVPVRISLYCLRGTTRRGHRVRAGIMAADPRLFPLGRYVEVYLGERWIGRFLVDDTGRRITGDRVDVWVADCDRASEFGIRRGTAVRVAAR